MPVPSPPVIGPKGVVAGVSGAVGYAFVTALPTRGDFGFPSNFLELTDGV